MIELHCVELCFCTVFMRLFSRSLHSEYILAHWFYVVDVNIHDITSSVQLAQVWCENWKSLENRLYSKYKYICLQLKFGMNGKKKLIFFYGDGAVFFKGLGAAIILLLNYANSLKHQEVYSCQTLSCLLKESIYDFVKEHFRHFKSNNYRILFYSLNILKLQKNPLTLINSL